MIDGNEVTFMVRIVDNASWRIRYISCSPDLIYSGVAKGIN